jgi:hypothetical protein
MEKAFIDMHPTRRGLFRVNTLRWCELFLILFTGNVLVRVLIGHLGWVIDTVINVKCSVLSDDSSFTNGQNTSLTSIQSVEEWH